MKKASSQIVACTVDTPYRVWEKICALATKRKTSKREIWISAISEYLEKNTVSKECK